MTKTNQTHILIGQLNIQPKNKMKKLIQSLQTLMIHAGIEPSSPGSFSDLLEFYKQEPEAPEAELNELAEAITVVLEAPMPRVSSVREFVDLSIINFIDLLMGEMDDNIKNN